MRLRRDTVGCGIPPIPAMFLMLRRIGGLLEGLLHDIMRTYVVKEEDRCGRFRRSFTRWRSRLTGGPQAAIATARSLTLDLTGRPECHTKMYPCAISCFKGAGREEQEFPGANRRSFQILRMTMIAR